MTLFGPLFVPEEVRERVSDEAWVEAMLDAERALARAEAAAGVIPSEAADAIASACRAELFDPTRIASRLAARTVSSMSTLPVQTRTAPRSSSIRPAVATAEATTPGTPAPGWVPAPTK